MDKFEDKSGVWILIGVIVGAIVGEVGFVIFLSFFTYLFGFLFIPRDIGTPSNDTVFLGCLLLPFGSGAFCGLAGAYLARKRHKRFGPWVGACIGGLILAIIAALLMQLLLFPILW